MKKAISILMVLFVLSVSVIGCGQKQTPVSKGTAGSPKLEKVIVADIRGESWLPVYLAYQLGYFKEQGLNVEFATYKDGPIAFQGMHAGDSQFCMLSSEPVMRAYDEGKESVIILSTLTNKPYMFVTRKGINKISDLKGKVVFAGMPGSAPYTFVSSLLAKEGLDPQKDVTWANLEYGATLAALEKGQVDGAYLRSISKADAIKIGANILVNVSDPVEHKKMYGSDKYESSIVTVTKKYAETNPETIQKFTNAVVKAIVWQTGHSDEEVAKTIIPLFPNFRVEYVTALRSSLSKTGEISEEGHQIINDFCKQQGIIKKDIPYQNIIDMTYINKANQEFNK